jgi:glutaconyl-CoA/methylmalonyl-CoA decarboxylase subunit gamma
MHTYKITVNGNTYNVTVKSIAGKKALVDVDGWEFEVAIGDSAPQVVVPAVAAAVKASVEAPPKVEPPKPLVEKVVPQKRTSAIEATSPKKTSGLDVSAHLPGLILEILVKPGDKVSSGDLLIKMEAMKMVNEIRARNAGTVKDVLVTLQQNVQEHQPLLVIE